MKKHIKTRIQNLYKKALKYPHKNDEINHYLTQLKLGQASRHTLYALANCIDAKPPVSIGNRIESKFADGHTFPHNLVRTEQGKIFFVVDLYSCENYIGGNAFDMDLKQGAPVVDVFYYIEGFLGARGFFINQTGLISFYDDEIPTHIYNYDWIWRRETKAFQKKMRNSGRYREHVSIFDNDEDGEKFVERLLVK